MWFYISRFTPFAKNYSVLTRIVFIVMIAIRSFGRRKESALSSPCCPPQPVLACQGPVSGLMSWKFSSLAPSHADGTVAVGQVFAHLPLRGQCRNRWLNVKHSAHRSSRFIPSANAFGTPEAAGEFMRLFTCCQQ